jgi:hypothetical protein
MVYPAAGIANSTGTAWDTSYSTTGSGTVVALQTSPTFNTSITSPLLIGGTTASSTLTLESTSGAGTSDSIIFKTGSQVTAMTINTSQYVGIGTASPASQLTVYGAGQTTASFNTTTSLGGSLMLSDSGSSGGNGGAIVFSAAGTAWRFAGIKGLVANGTNNTQGDIAFLVRPVTTNTTLSEAMRVGYNGSVGIGTSGTLAVQTTLNVGKNITGAVTSYGIYNTGTIQSDVTTSAYVVNSAPSTAATSFTLTNLFHYQAVQGTIGIGSQITNQYGFYYNSGARSAATNYAFYSNIASGAQQTISNVALTSNVVTITTAANHNYGVGQTVIINATTTTSINGTFTITSIPSTTTFTYALVLGDIASTADTGTTIVYGATWAFYNANTAPSQFGGSLSVGQSNNTFGAALTATTAASFKAGGFAYTDLVTATGTAAQAAMSLFASSNLLARNTVTYTNAATVWINAAPVASTNVTITNRWAMYVANNDAYFNNGVAIGSASAGTGLTAATHWGGTAASSTLTLQSTSGVGTTDSILFKVGNNGATTALTIATSGNATFLSTSTTAIGTLTLTNALGAIYGGTGQTAVTTGDLLYGSGTNAWGKLADVATGSVLVSGGVGVAPAWSASPTVTSITSNQSINTNNAITATANAATVPVTYRTNTVTNNSAATLTITLTTTSAVDGQMTVVRILDATAVAQTITWVNTENSSVSVPTTSNGSTTLPLTVGFQYNANTSKWRCLASA